MHGTGEVGPRFKTQSLTKISYKDKVLPELRKIEGYKGGYVLRLDGSEEVEFVVVNLFESWEAVKRFAGPNYGVPVFEPEAKKLLCRIEALANHYDVRAVQ